MRVLSILQTSNVCSNIFSDAYIYIHCQNKNAASAIDLFINIEQYNLPLKNFNVELSPL